MPGGSESPSLGWGLTSRPRRRRMSTAGGLGANRVGDRTRRPGVAKMRILVNSATLSPNTGISVQTLQVAEELADTGPPPRPGLRRGRPLPGALRVVLPLDETGPGARPRLRGARRQVPRLVPAVRAGRRHPPDVIYLNRFKPLPWALATSTFTRAPVVCHLHGLVGIGTPVVNRNLSRFTTPVHLRLELRPRPVRGRGG